MITVDNVELNWQTPPDVEGYTNEKWAAEEIQNLLDTKKLIQYDRKFFKRDDIGNLVTRPGSFFNCVAKRVNPKTKREETWKLVNTELYDREKKIYPAQRVREELSILINVQKDAEKAFFYYHIFQTGLGKVGFVLNDPDREAKKENTFAAKEAEVRHIILNQLSEEDITIRCSAYGLDPRDKSFDVKKRELRQRVTILNGKGTDVFDQFIRNAKKNTPELVVQAKVNDAFRNRTLVMDELTCRYNNTKEALCNVPAEKLADRARYVSEWLMMNDRERTIFLDLVGGEIKETQKPAVEWRSVINVPQLRKIARDKFGATQEDVDGMVNKDACYAWLEEHDK